MKILVIEDKARHRKSAEKTLAGHDVTITESFDEAMRLLAIRPDEEKVKLFLREAGFPEPHELKDKDQDRRTAYWTAYHRAEYKFLAPIPFEVVLTDMMMPMSQSRVLRLEFYNPIKQVPYGFIITLKAALLGAKFVAMVTDTNHHAEAMSAALDHIDAYYGTATGLNPVFTINGARVAFVHAVFCKAEGEWESCKDWGKILADLTA
ncbi:MAG: hypothetical protein NT170_04260 [Candidatus Moranbacteria bacterium]|nr:hypothetical protein [Candidatus Moranbacteria bacterium]